MARKVVDLTEKLGLAEKPAVKVGDVELVVDDSARNMLQIMKLMEEGYTPQNIIDMCDLLFDKASRKELDKLGLSFADFTAVIEAAIDLVMGDGEGNAETPATT